MQSLRVNDELNKNNFQQHMYVVRVKPTAKPFDLHEFFPSSAVILEFDDDEEIVLDKKLRQQCGRDEDTEMNKANPMAFSKELRFVDVNSQFFLSLKWMWGEPLQITGDLYVGRGIFAHPDQNCECNSNSETKSDSEEDKQISGGSPLSGETEDE